jgi:hypothetical protein
MKTPGKTDDDAPRARPASSGGCAGSSRPRAAARTHPQGRRIARLRRLARAHPLGRDCRARHRRALPPGQGQLREGRVRRDADGARDRRRRAARADAAAQAEGAGQRRLWLCRHRPHPGHADRRARGSPNRRPVRGAEHPRAVAREAGACPRRRRRVDRGRRRRRVARRARPAGDPCADPSRGGRDANDGAAAQAAGAEGKD